MMTPRQMQYHIAGGLSSEEIEAFHQASLRLIRSVGLRVPHDGIRRRLEGRRGVKVEGDTVYFAPDLVEESLAAQEYPDYTKSGEFRLVSGAYELNVLDLETGVLRSPTCEDLRQLTKIADALDAVGSAAVRPQDIPPALQEIAEYKITWENSRYISQLAFEANEKSSVTSAEVIYRMSQVAGKPFSLGVWVKSPFKLSEMELEVVHHFLERRVPLWAATMPTAGATSPIFLAGSYVQSMAELFAAVTLLWVVGEGVPVHSLIIDSIRAYPFDMRHATFVYGSPEDILCTLMQVQLNARYAIPVVAKSLLTCAKEPDGHACAEKAAHTVVAALAGARMFTNGGLLAVDEIFSAEQLVIDHEIVQYAKRLTEGVRLDEEALSVDLIKEVGIGGEFLSHESTARNFRSLLWDPVLFEHSSLKQWLAAGRPTFRERAKRRAKELLASHHYELPGDVQAELDSIFRHAERTLA